DEELGTLDGLVADGGLGAARYAVVDAGGVLMHRRYLLPLSLIRFAESTRALRVNVDKQAASRYPPFDRDEFQTMSDADRMGYERRLLQFFPSDEGGVPREPLPASLPDWLMSGLWIT